MAPLLATLPAKRTVLVPAGLLGLLPLHAAWTNDPHTPTGRRYALDEALRTYAPNARALTAARRLADRIPVEHVLVVEEPWPVDASPLPYVLDEARAALAAFPLARHLRREQRWLRDHPGTERRSANADEVDAVCQHYVAGGREDEEACSATNGSWGLGVHGCAGCVALLAAQCDGRTAWTLWRTLWPLHPAAPRPNEQGAYAGSQAPPSMGPPRTGCPLITRRSLSRTRGS
jgi:hypothetical protein